MHVVSVLLLCALTIPAAADAGLRDEAVRLFESQDFIAAADAFQRCYQQDRDASCLYGQGQAYRMAGDCTHAVAAYRAFLRTNPPSEPRQKALLNIEACEQSATDAPTPPATDEPAPPQPPAAEPRTMTRETPRYRDGLTLGLGAATLAATAAGATFLVLAKSARDDAAAEGGGSGTHQAFVDALERADRHQLTGTLVVAGAGALAVATVLRYALHDNTTTVTVSSTTAAGLTSRWITLSSQF
jgi:tetratricopeptide (TPR) repeat protein